MKYFFLSAFLFVVSLTRASVTDECRASLTDNLFIVENDVVSLIFDWNDGNVRLMKIENKPEQKFVGLENSTAPKNQSGDLVLPELEDNPTNGRFEQKVTAKSQLEPEYLQVEVYFELGDVEVKRVFKVYPGIAAISNHFEFRGKKIEMDKQANSEERNRFGIIENANYNVVDAEDVPVVGSLPLSNHHWKFKAVEFTESTDHNNTLVQEDTYVAYRMPVNVEGNILMAQNKSLGTGLFILKEAPSAYNQQHYPGLDFSFSQKGIKVYGTGISLAEINEQEWLRGYGYVIGVTDEKEYNLLRVLKSYQKQTRALHDNRDEMILMNTWGDRSKDSRMNEAFIHKELESAARLGVTHLQLDDGWQQGLSRNSASKEGKKWNDWSIEDWQPHRQRFPNGFEPVMAKAQENGIEICLWFNPSKEDSYSNWKRDADILIDYFTRYGIKTFKIDGVDFPDKQAEVNLRRMFDRVYDATEGMATFNLDATAGRRAGYHYFTEYGNIFLENRYTDWGNYYPYHTHRNLWMLSKYVPAETLQKEFLNKWRNHDKYPPNDALAPENIPFEYIAAISFMAQPLAWFESTGLPDEAFSVAPVLKKYASIQYDLHSGLIYPIGAEPDGYSWSGFQSIHEDHGYLLIFRENNASDTQSIQVWMEEGVKLQLTPVIGNGSSEIQEVTDSGFIKFTLPAKYSFCLYRYELL